MHRMRPKKRAAADQLCRTRDGEKCVDCGRVPVAEVKDEQFETHQLIVHHRNNDPSDNPADGSNWILLCQRCNIKRDPRGKRTCPKFSSHLRLKEARERAHPQFVPLRHEMIYPPARDIEGDVPRVRNMEMAKNLQAEPLFIEFVTKIVSKHVQVNKLDLLDAGAQNFRNKTGNTISQQALGSYLKKLCNPFNGIYRYQQVDGEWFVTKKSAEDSEDDAPTTNR